MAGRKKLIHLHSGVYQNGTPLAPTSTELEKGEIAVNYNDNEPSLFLKNNSGNIVKFNAVTRSEISAITGDISNLETSFDTLSGSKISVNGVDKFISANTISIYAPGTSGTQGNILVSNGQSSSPSWVDPATIGMGTAAEAVKTVGALTISGNGTTLATFNGSANTSVNLTYANVGAAAASHDHTASELPTASTTDYGIVKLGSGATDAAPGNHTHPEYDNPPVSNCGETLTWGTESTIAKVGNTDITITAMAKPTASDIGAAAASHSHTAAELPTASTTEFGVVKIGNSAGTVAAGNHTHSAYVNPTVTNNSATWIWDGTVTAATIGNTAITITSPAKPTYSYEDVGAAPVSHQHDSGDLPLATTVKTGIVKVGDFLSVDVNGTLSAKTGTTSATLAIGNHTHNYAGSESAGGAANSTKGTLTLKNTTGGTIVAFNGSASSAITLNSELVGAAPASHEHTASDLPTASTTGYGIIKIGTGSDDAAAGNHTHSEYVNPAVSNCAQTLTWGNQTTVAKIGNTSITLTAMAKPTASDIGAAASTHSHGAGDLPTASTSTLGIVKVGNYLSATTAGTLSVKVGNTANDVAVGNHTHNYAGSSSAGGAANSVKESLVLKNYSGETISTFNGSSLEEVTIDYDLVGAAPASHQHTASDLPTASTTAYGLIKVGSGALDAAAGNHTHSQYENPSVTNCAETLTWGSEITAATIGTTPITITAMAKPTAAEIGAATSTHSHTAGDLPTASTSAFGIFKVGSFLSAENGVVSASTGTSSNTLAVGNHTHNYAGSSSAGGAANSVQESLVLKNYSGDTLTNFDGSSGAEITLNSQLVGAAPLSHSHSAEDLPLAESNKVGVVKPGSFLSVDSNGALSVTTGTSSTTVARGDHNHGTASTSSFGVMKVGSFLSESNGVVSVATGTSSSTVAVGNHTHQPSDIGAAAAQHSHEIGDLPVQTTLSSSSTELPTGSAVKTYVDGLISSPVNYKGAITNGTLPSSSNTKVGDMYIVQTSAIDLTTATSATGSAQRAEVGDYLIARSAGKWDVMEKNITGAVTSSVNLTTDKFIVGNANNQTVKTTNYGPSSFAAAEHSHGAGELPTASTTEYGIVKLGTGATDAAVGDHTHSAYVNPSVTNCAQTLTWGTETTVAKIGNTSLTITSMAKPTASDIGAASSTHSHVASELPTATTSALGIIKVGSFLSVATDGTLSVSTGTSSTTVARGNHTHNYAGSSSAGGAANSVTGTLTLKNSTGGTIVTFNGSESTSLTLTNTIVGAAEVGHSHNGSDINAATTSALGTVKVGSFLSAATDGTLSVKTGTTNSTVARGDHDHGTASTSSFGVMKVGSFLSASNGVVSVSTGTTNATVARGDHSHTYSQVGAAAASHTHGGGDITSAVANATNADKVDGYHVSVVTTMPSTPDANTIYILK